MSYRNDHDAALARVDALQAEVARLEKAATTPPVRRGRTNRWLGAGIGIVTLAGIVTGALLLPTAEADPQTSEAVAELDTRVHRTRLDLCVEAIAKAPQGVAPDDVSPGDLRVLEASAAPCRAALREVRGDGLWSPSELVALDAWITAEETLGNTISLMSVYYSDQPPRDNNAASAQLWREYGRARTSRDEAIVHWRETR